MRPYIYTCQICNRHNLTTISYKLLKLVAKPLTSECMYLKRREYEEEKTDLELIQKLNSLKLTGPM